MFKSPVDVDVVDQAVHEVHALLDDPFLSLLPEHHVIPSSLNDFDLFVHFLVYQVEQVVAVQFVVVLVFISNQPQLRHFGLHYRLLHCVLKG